MSHGYGHIDQIKAKTISLLVFAFLFSGCSENKQTSVKNANKPTQSANDDSDDASDGFEEEKEPVQDLETILGQCGVTEKDLEDPDKVILETTIRSWPKVFTGAQSVVLLGNIEYRVSVTTLVSIKATLKQIEQSTDFEIKGTPSQAEKPAWEKAAPNKGSSTMTVLGTDDRANLMSKSDWHGIYCTILPVTELSTTKGGTGKVVTFNPPLPGSLSPKADPERYLAELGESRTFSNIKAEIIGSQDSNYPEGKTFTGTVTIKKVDPTLIINISGKSQQTISTDLAFKVTYDFGSVADTVGIGLMPSQTMYMSHKTKDVRVIVANTGFEDGGIVVLSEDFNP